MKPCAARSIAAAALFVFAVSLPAEQQPARPVLRSGIDLVTVDVTVLSRSGEPLVELAPDDFTITVDGVPRRIVALRLVRQGTEPGQPVAQGEAPAGATAAVRWPPRPSARRFLLVIDRDHIPAGEGQQMLEAGARFIEGLPASDSAAVWTIPPAKSGLQFSTDRDAVKRELRLAVGTYRPPLVGGVYGRGQFNIGREEALQIADDNRRDVLVSVQQRECPTFDPAHLSCPDDVETAAKIVASDWHQRAQVTLTALNSLVRALGTVVGTKDLVLITGGPLNTREELGLIEDVAAIAAASRVTVHAMQVIEAPYQARTDQMRATHGTIDQALSAAYFLAGSTGGLAMTPVSGDVGFQQLTRALSASYELAFEALAADRDGKPHRIDVQVRDRGWGSLVRARRSFRIDPAAPAVASAPVTGPAAGGAEAPPVPPAAPAEPLGTDASDLAGRLADYVERFEREFSVVVAEERYVQMVHPWRGNPKGPDSEPMLAWQEKEAGRAGGPIIARRQMLSDILLVQSRDQQWVAFRDVAVVDGRQIRDRTERIRDLFLSKGPNGLAELRAITEESARYNLGNVRRTVNIPTITLSFMRRAEQWRYQYKRLRDETVGERTCRVLSFDEKARPTLIGTANSGDIPIQGRIWLDAADGRVLRTELRFDRGGERRVLIRTEFRSEPGFGVLVPQRMWEWYEGADQLGRIGGDKTLLQALATYSAIRRFQVSTSEEIKR